MSISKHNSMLGSIVYGRHPHIEQEGGGKLQCQTVGCTGLALCPTPDTSLVPDYWNAHFKCFGKRSHFCNAVSGTNWQTLKRHRGICVGRNRILANESQQKENLVAMPETRRAFQGFQDEAIQKVGNKMDLTWGISSQIMSILPQEAETEIQLWLQVTWLAT